MEELKDSLATKERLITRLYRERSVLEEEISDLREIITKLKKSLKNKSQIKIQMTLPSQTEIERDPIVEVVTIDSD